MKYTYCICKFLIFCLSAVIVFSLFYFMYFYDIVPLGQGKVFFKGNEFIVFDYLDQLQKITEGTL